MIRSGAIARHVRARSARAALHLLEFGAGNETRTRDPDLGKVVLYQLSYSRIRNRGARDSMDTPREVKADAVTTHPRNYFNFGLNYTV
jgi:hypothetical protein